MKKKILFSMLCLAALTMNAQSIAVVGFSAGANVSLSDIDGISETFTTYFRPNGYSLVDRLRIDKALAEQRIQRSSITESQAVEAGRYLNVSKIVVGKVYISFDGGYQVDVAVLDVESGLLVANDGITVTRGSYRQNIQTLATRLAGKIAITPSAPVSAASAPTAKKRTSVDVLYGYLKIFPNELGVFHAEPTSVIRQINAQAQHGYNNWRIPTNEELSLLRANGYLSGGEYMTRESKHGTVLLVSDGDDYPTVQEKERKAEKERQARIRAEQEREAKQWVDLGLPSGTRWKEKNEEGGFYTYEQALNKFGDRLPTNEQFEELRNKCSWSWTGRGYKVTGPNGNSIFLPAAGCRGYDWGVGFVGSNGFYWSSQSIVYFSSSVRMSSGSTYTCDEISVRLVQD